MTFVVNNCEAKPALWNASSNLGVITLYNIQWTYIISLCESGSNECKAKLSRALHPSISPLHLAFCIATTTISTNSRQDNHGYECHMIQHAWITQTATPSPAVIFY